MAKKVMIVDDMMYMRMKLKVIVESIGGEVVGEATNGREAITRYQTLQPDIVLMDVTMPELDGLGALKAIREVDPKAVVIIVSAMGQEAIVKQAIISGASNFIVKPFEEEKVKKVVSAYL